MKKNIAVIVCTAVLAVGTNFNSTHAKQVEVEVAVAPAAVPEPPDTPEAPIPPLANFGEAVQAYQLIPGMGGQGSSASRAGRALVIPKEAGDPKELKETEEDLNVMARILEKAASGRDDKHPHAMGIAIQGNLFGPGSSSVPRNLYIEGHGAIFFLNVNFPLLAPATKSSEADATDKTSTEWEEARRELYQKAGSGFEFNWKTATTGGPAEEYDADKVEDLKRDVTGALKNASHIRKLKSDETVTVVISGRGAGGEARIVKRSSSGSGGTTAIGESKTLRRSSAGGGGTSASTRPAEQSAQINRSLGEARALARSAGGESHGTKLILRARKADIESFQKDKLSLEDFRKKVTTIVY
jgi:hypothetical protein